MPRLAIFSFGKLACILSSFQPPVSESPANTTDPCAFSRWDQNAARLSFIHGCARIGPVPGQAFSLLASGKGVGPVASPALAQFSTNTAISKATRARIVDVFPKRVPPKLSAFVASVRLNLSTCLLNFLHTTRTDLLPKRSSAGIVVYLNPGLFTSAARLRDTPLAPAKERFT